MRGREGEKEGEGEGKRERLFATQGFMSGSLTLACIKGLAAKLRMPVRSWQLRTLTTASDISFVTVGR